MPIFEYKCAECGHVTEFLEKPDAGGEHRCEQCGGGELEKAFSAFSARMAPSAARAPSSCESCPTGTCPMRR